MRILHCSVFSCQGTPFHRNGEQAAADHAALREEFNTLLRVVSRLETQQRETQELAQGAIREARELSCA